ncbi:MAG: 2OG-Fe(II) oxygenase [Cyanobacteria bacterium J06626_18]
MVRYDGKTRGFFSPHRDNNTREVAKRRFALTLNLNSPATYKGGALRLNPQR